MREIPRQTACIAAAALALIVQLWICGPLVASYFPTDDMIALLVASTTHAGPPDWTAWFTDGFHDYLLPYPEWNEPATDFVRPLSNLYIAALYAAFGDHWGLHLIPGYVLHAVVVGVVVWIASGVLRLSPGRVALCGLIALLSPAYWSRAHYPAFFAALARDPICQTEILSGLLMLVAFLALLQKRFVLLCLVTLAALLTKEAALTVPVAALLLWRYWWTADRATTLRNLALILLPLILWGGLRLFVFEHGAHFYAMGDGSTVHTLAGVVLRKFLLWPTALFHDSAGTVLGRLMHLEWRGSWQPLLQLGTNTAWWLALLAAGLRAARSWVAPATSAGPVAAASAALMFALGNLGMVMLIEGSSARYGYFWFALGPAALFTLVQNRPGQRPLLAAALSLALLLPVAIDVARTYLPGASLLRSYQEMRHAGRSLSAVLAALPPEVEVAYLVDNYPSQSSSPDYLARFAGFAGTLVLINTIVPIENCEKPLVPPPPRYHLRMQGPATWLTYQPPACFNPQVNFVADDQARRTGQVGRGPHLSYQYPETPPGTDRFAQAARWTVESRDPRCQRPGACVWIGLDEQRFSYSVVEPAPMP